MKPSPVAKKKGRRTKGDEVKVADKLKITVINSFRGGVFTGQEIREAWERVHPELPFDGRIIMSDYCVNTISGYGTVSDTDRFLFRVKQGVYRIYDPQRDGQWQRIDDTIRQTE